MKKNRIFGLATAALLLGAAACSNDMIEPGKTTPGQLTGDNGMGGVYMTVDFKLPDGSNGTRSATIEGGGSNGGTEVGTDAENNVTSALIVLAFDKADAPLNNPENITVEDYGYIVSGEVSNNHIANLSSTDNGKLFEAAAKLSKENLNTFYGLFYEADPEDPENPDKGQYKVPEVRVFVFCNPTLELRQYFAGAPETIKFGSAEWIDKTCTVIQRNSDGQPDQNIGIWGTNSFLMNNKTVTKRELPSNLLDWEYYNSYEKAFHLSKANNQNGITGPNNGTNERGAVLVERSVARFDFKDGSELKQNRYDVLFATDESETEESKVPMVGVQMQKMCLVNMSNKFYYVPRVSDNGMPGGSNFEICGRERPWTRNTTLGTYSNGNYVVGPYAAEFSKAASTFVYEDSESGNPILGTSTITLEGQPLVDYFNFPFFDKNGLFNSDEMNVGGKWDVVKIEDVLSNGSKDNYNNKQEYNVWRYVTENIIPSIEDQVNGISTGVVFKAKMIPAVDAPADPSAYDDYWSPGAYANLINCLSGKTFTYNGVDHTLQGNSKDDPILYYFSGRLYMGWRHIRQAAIQESITMDVSGKLEINTNTSLYQAVFGDGPIPAGMIYKYLDENNELKDKTIEDPRWNTTPGNADYENYLKSADYAWTKWHDVNDSESIGEDEQGELLNAMRMAVTGAGITIYQSSSDKDFNNEAGYYCYYYYWNRHNDNGFDGSMGPMEFDVVRNNVYKLSVDKVSRLGHPRIPANDPNNPDPGTKDESDDIYLDVNVEIAPWVVRVNSIKF
ncbi:MAG: Mfa1 fimbrilin C-terminal domain-containing protein [Muribaculaceae bacterium]|nr:Mfa1 fimbrilin C-terminal domain-containing protein [Muribaculaceae bacterium]